MDIYLKNLQWSTEKTNGVSVLYGILKSKCDFKWQILTKQSSHLIDEFNIKNICNS